VRNPEDVERLPPVSTAEELLAGGYLDEARRAVQAFGGERFVIASAAAPFWLANGYLTFEGLMTAVIENAEVLRLLLERLAREQVEGVRAAAAAGVDGIWVEDCYSSADLISPEHFRRFALPYVERVIAEAERLGLRAVYYFCGDVSDRLEDLIATHPTALSLEESKKGFRIELGEVAEVVRGRCALLGNLDAIHLLERGDREMLQGAMAAQAAASRCTACPGRPRRMAQSHNPAVVYRLITEKPLRESMSRSALFTETAYTPHMNASARAIAIPIRVPAAVKSSLKYTTPSRPVSDSPSPSQKRGLRSKGLSSGKNTREKLVTHRIEVLVNRVMNAGAR
jgi:hypothetical protein